MLLYNVVDLWKHSNPIRWVIGLCIGCMLFGLSITLAPLTVRAQANVDGALAAQISLPPGSSICVGVSAIPEMECNALVALYQSTDGAQWLDNTNWLTVNANISPCNWHGVVCEVGHVVQLA